MAKLWGMKPLFAEDDVAKIVEAVSGACLMIKRSVFEMVGMFSTDYFMYSEDVDLCFKVRMIGLKTYYIPRAVIVHHGGGSSTKYITSNFSSVMMLESRWRYFRKTRPRWYSKVYSFTMFGASIARIGLLLLLWPLRGLNGRKSVVENALKKWMAILRWTLGGERWSKNH
jgi:GT2 family glycosyltransferase